MMYPSQWLGSASGKVLVANGSIVLVPPKLRAVSINKTKFRPPNFLIW